jgi:hypothetical protein
MKTRISFAVVFFVSALPLFAQQAPVQPQPARMTQPQARIEYTPVGCFRADEMNILSMWTTSEGVLRAYFRPVGGSDWCSVEGQNLGKNSIVVMPKFDDGKEYEYYFVTIKKNEITARSSRVYRARVTPHCDTLVSRKTAFLILDCNPLGGGMPAAMGAGYSAKDVASTDYPPLASPDKPTTTNQ